MNNLEMKTEETSVASLEQKKKTSVKKIIGTILFVLLNIGVILWSAFSEFSDSESAVEFSQIEVKWVFLLPAAGCLVVAILIETTKYCLLMKKMCGKANFKICLENVIFGRYYDNVTPSGIGGQPYQIYHMNKNGVPAAPAAAIPLFGFLSMQYGFIIVALISFFFGGYESDVIRITRYFGLVMYALVPTSILVATFFPKVSKKILGFGAKILSKIKLIKNPDKIISKIETTVDDYVICVKEVLKSRGLCAKTLFLSILYQIAICSIPFCIVYAFGGTLNYLVCFCTITSIYAAITFIPTPGNAGAAEGSFYAVFSMLTEGYVFWAMLSWRFLTSYIYIGTGILIYLFKNLSSKKRRGIDTNEGDKMS